MFSAIVADGLHVSHPQQGTRVPVNRLLLDGLTFPRGQLTNRGGNLFPIPYPVPGDFYLVPTKTDEYSLQIPILVIGALL